MFERFFQKATPQKAPTPATASPHVVRFRAKRRELERQLNFALEFITTAIRQTSFISRFDLVHGNTRDWHLEIETLPPPLRPRMTKLIEVLTKNRQMAMRLQTTCEQVLAASRQVEVGQKLLKDLPPLSDENAEVLYNKINVFPIDETIDIVKQVIRIYDVFKIDPTLQEIFEVTQSLEAANGTPPARNLPVVARPAPPRAPMPPELVPRVQGFQNALKLHRDMVARNQRKFEILEIALACPSTEPPQLATATAGLPPNEAKIAVQFVRVLTSNSTFSDRAYQVIAQFREFRASLEEADTLLDTLPALPPDQVPLRLEQFVQSIRGKSSAVTSFNQLYQDFLVTQLYPVKS